jgi:hypothetical protein
VTSQAVHPSDHDRRMVLTVDTLARLGVTAAHFGLVRDMEEHPDLDDHTPIDVKANFNGDSKESLTGSTPKDVGIFGDMARAPQARRAG